MEQKDYYEILGVSQTASLEDIKKTYRKLAFQCHPDRTGGDPQLTQKMKEVNEAYATLSDSKKRNEYDTLRSLYGSGAYKHFRQTYSEEDIFRGSDINQIFEEFAKMFSGFRMPEDLFSQTDFYGNKYKTFEFKRPGFSARGVFFSFGPTGKTMEQIRQKAEGQKGVHQGPRAPIHLRLLNRILGYFGEKLIARLEIPTRGKDLFDNIIIAPKDIGKKIQYPAKKKWKRTTDMMITIPQEIKNSQRIKLKGQGTPGRHGGEPGDLYIEVHIKQSLIKRLIHYLMHRLKK
jgi:curved DNA-binding protein CbpA